MGSTCWFPRVAGDTTRGCGRSISATRRCGPWVRVLAHVADEYGVETTAEGVENEGSLELLRGYGVDQAQGYHIGRPAPVRD